jgi:hypothetical protein
MGVATDTMLADLANADVLNTNFPAVDWNPVTPHASNAQPGFPCRALRATVAGNIAVYTPRSPAVARVMAFAAGETRQGIFLRVLASGTTATGIEAGS